MVSRFLNLRLFARLIMAICLVSACNDLPWLTQHNPPPPEDTFLTGECFHSSDLTYIQIPSDGEQRQLYGNFFLFSFRVDFTDFTRKQFRSEGMQPYWTIPSSNIFSSFGDNSSLIENTFHNQRKQLKSGPFQKSSSVDVATILYNGGISLVGNKDFAGYSAGEDLSEHIVFLEAQRKYLTSSEADFFDIPYEFEFMLGKYISFLIPTNGYELSKQGVSFKLEIPVKVVHYLTWLNDKITNDEALPPYSDEVLHCEFTTTFGLK